MDMISVERFRSKEPRDIGLQNPRSTEHCKTYSCVICLEGPGDPQTIQEILQTRNAPCTSGKNLILSLHALSGLHGEQCVVSKFTDNIYDRVGKDFYNSLRSPVTGSWDETSSMVCA